jgi:hypothetical protein
MSNYGVLSVTAQSLWTQPVSPRSAPLSERVFQPSGTTTDGVNSKTHAHPMFRTQWPVQARPEEKRQRAAPKESVALNLDGKGKLLGTAQLGPRKKKKVSV